MKILFKYTTRSRPELFHRGMRSIIDNCASDDYVILVTLDENDQSMIDADKHYNDDRIIFVKGISTDKVNAINRDVEKVREWDILVNMSDDMVFTKKGFDYSIRNSFDNLNQCLHFPDGNTKQLITMAIIGRGFYDRFGYIYNPAYKSLFCDNEQMEVAIFIGAYKFIDIDIIDHKHPIYNKAQMDAQYIHTEGFWNEDKATYLYRKSKNFDL